MRRVDGRHNIKSVKCPKCNSASLLPLELGDILLDRCEECAGLWFDHGELEAVIGAGGAAQLNAMDSPPEGESHGGLCPRCKVEMLPVAASQDPTRPVAVDRCPSCMGLWLKRKRLKAIEDSRLLLTVRELFIGSGRDEALLGALEEPSRLQLLSVLELLRVHPNRTAILAYLERESGGMKYTPCDSEE